MPGPILTIELLNADAVQRQIKQYHDKAIPALAAAMYQLGSAVIADAIPRTPKKTGTLRNSGYCALPVIKGNSVTVEGGFGGYAKAYAWVQHENMSYRHTEGGPKYLERALAAKEPMAAEHVANAVAQAFETGTTPPLHNNGIPASATGGGSAKPRKGTPRKAPRGTPRRPRGRK